MDFINQNKKTYSMNKIQKKLTINTIRHVKYKKLDMNVYVNDSNRTKNKGYNDTVTTLLILGIVSQKN